MTLARKRRLKRLSIILDKFEKVAFLKAQSIFLAFI